MVKIFVDFAEFCIHINLFRDYNIIILLTARKSENMFHSEARVILKITNSGNDQLKSLSTRQDEKNKKIFKTQDSSMTNDT